MSLITRCPTCETMFKVVPDQLRISEGWVRCGQCGEIFNASQSLVAAEASRPASPAVSSRQETTAMVVRVPVATRAPATASSTAVTVPPAVPDAPIGQFEQKVWDLNAGSDETLPAASLPPPPATAVATPAFTPQEPVWADQGPPPNKGEEPAVSFMRQEAPNRFWNRNPVRVILAAMAVLLTGLLLAQVLVQERNRIVLLEPVSRPVLQAVCRVARCEISPLRQIESVVIESSSFGRLRSDGYRLGFALRNQAPIDIAMPAIELSLTDTQDQPLIRRVILPSEFGAPGNVLAAGADWSGTLALSVRPGTNTDRIAGYRLLAFYP